MDDGVLPENVHIGWLKIAFMYSMYYLKEESYTYDLAIRHMLKQGGDTDTNACIVGGIMGALCGVKGLNERHVAKVM